MPQFMDPIRNYRVVSSIHLLTQYQIYNRIHPQEMLHYLQNGSKKQISKATVQFTAAFLRYLCFELPFSNY